MMTLPPGIGRDLPSILSGTWASHSSSSADSREEFDVYHEPAWLAGLVVILSAVVKGLEVVKGISNLRRAA